MVNGPRFSSPGEFGEPDLPKRRRKEGLWQTIPAGVKIAAALCLVFLAVFFFVNRNRTPAEPELKAVKPRVSAGEAFDKVVSNTKQIDLVLTKAVLNPGTSRIEGVVTNTSDRQYSNVNIEFFVSLGDLTQGSVTLVQVARLEPRGSAEFASDPVDRRAKEWAVKSIAGTPR
jgi:hypothetical protein